LWKLSYLEKKQQEWYLQTVTFLENAFLAQYSCNMVPAKATLRAGQLEPCSGLGVLLWFSSDLLS
jgi:hypothetical protein